MSAIRSLCAAVLFACTPAGHAQQPSPGGIPEEKVAELQKDLGGLAGERSSVVRMRRDCKNIVRDGEALLASLPTAANRYQVLAILLQAEKKLLGLEKSAPNQEALFETCRRMADVPDEYAELRLEADLLLSDRDLTLANADLAERAEALTALVQKYRGTPAEVKSLKMAALIAPKIEAFDLEAEIIDTLNARFAGDPAVIGWLRQNLGASEVDVLFKGNFKRADGTAISFPVDGMGQTCMMYFWTLKTPGFEKPLAEIKDLQTRCPGQFQVFSFNLDELPDAGEKTLRTLGLDWTALHLPGGRQSDTYRAYATRDFLCVRVNAHGHAFVHPVSLGSQVEQTPLEQDLDDARYLAQLQSLLIGDFLVDGNALDGGTPSSGGAVPAETMEAIQSCFIPAPMRYRLSPAQALANYEKAEGLCREAIAANPQAPDLWQVRNRRIIALLGMWKVGTEPKHLLEAVKEAQAALSADPPKGAELVARFCLAKAALRDGGAAPKSVLADLIAESGAAAAPAPAYAAAALLAMDANDRDLHQLYRETLLQSPNDDPALWPVIAFLRDQNHRFRLFEANYYHPPSGARRMVRAQLRRNAVDLDAKLGTQRTLAAEMVSLDGKAFSLPAKGTEKLELLLFLEAPADEASATIQNEIVQRATQLADSHLCHGIEVIAAFLSEDKAAVAALAEKNGWTCKIAMVPGGLENPLVRKLGILSADRMPNIALLRPDGTLAWTLSGIVHPQLKSEGPGELMGVVDRGIRENIEVCEMEAALGALRNGDFAKAAALFSESYPPPKKPAPTGWTAPRLYGRALAHMGTKQWELALADVDAAIAAHRAVFAGGAACPCQDTAEFLQAKTFILKQLGRPQEEGKNPQAEKSHSTNRYGSFIEKLRGIRLEHWK